MTETWKVETPKHSYSTRDKEGNVQIIISEYKEHISREAIWKVNDSESKQFVANSIPVWIVCFKCKFYTVGCLKFYLISASDYWLRSVITVFFQSADGDGDSLVVYSTRLLLYSDQITKDMQTKFQRLNSLTQGTQVTVNVDNWTGQVSWLLSGVINCQYANILHFTVLRGQLCPS